MGRRPGGLSWRGRPRPRPRRRTPLAVDNAHHTPHNHTATRPHNHTATRPSRRSVCCVDDRGPRAYAVLSAGRPHAETRPGSACGGADIEPKGARVTCPAHAKIKDVGRRARETNTRLGAASRERGRNNGTSRARRSGGRNGDDTERVDRRKAEPRRGNDARRFPPGPRLSRRTTAGTVRRSSRSPRRAGQAIPDTVPWWHYPRRRGGRCLACDARPGRPKGLAATDPPPAWARASAFPQSQCSGYPHVWAAVAVAPLCAPASVGRSPRRVVVQRPLLRCPHRKFPPRRRRRLRPPARRQPSAASSARRPPSRYPRPLAGGRRARARAVRLATHRMSRARHGGQWPPPRIVTRCRCRRQRRSRRAAPWPAAGWRVQSALSVSAVSLPARAAGPPKRKRPSRRPSPDSRLSSDRRMRQPSLPPPAWPRPIRTSAPPRIRGRIQCRGSAKNVGRSPGAPAPCHAGPPGWPHLLAPSVFVLAGPWRQRPRPLLRRLGLSRPRYALSGGLPAPTRGARSLAGRFVLARPLGVMTWVVVPRGSRAHGGAARPRSTARLSTVHAAGVLLASISKSSVLARAPPAPRRPSSSTPPPPPPCRYRTVLTGDAQIRKTQFVIIATGARCVFPTPPAQAALHGPRTARGGCRCGALRRSRQVVSASLCCDWPRQQELR